MTFEIFTVDGKKEQQEFSVSTNEYRLLAEGDFGVLTFQGTRYISFERGIKNV